MEMQGGKSEVAAAFPTFLCPVTTLDHRIGLDALFCEVSKPYDFHPIPLPKKLTLHLLLTPQYIPLLCHWWCQTLLCQHREHLNLTGSLKVGFGSVADSQFNIWSQKQYHILLLSCHAVPVLSHLLVRWSSSVYNTGSTTILSKFTTHPYEM